MKFRKVDSAMPAVALITGIAAGAVISLLFAPKKGSESRDLIAGKLNDLTRILKKKKPLEIKDHLVDDVRTHVKETADHLIGSKETTDPVKHTLKQTGPKSRRLPVES